MPDIRRVFAYHGAEHMTVKTHEAGEQVLNGLHFSAVLRNTGSAKAGGNILGADLDGGLSRQVDANENNAVAYRGRLQPQDCFLASVETDAGYLNRILKSALFLAQVMFQSIT